MGKDDDYRYSQSFRGHQHSGHRSDTPPWAIDLYDKLVSHINTCTEKIMATQAEVAAKLAALTQGVAAETEVIDAVGTLLNNLSKMIKDLQTQVANVDVPQSIADSIDAIGAAVAANKDKIAADVTANTPAA